MTDLVASGHPEIVFILLNAGLSAKQKDSFSQTPLHSACIKGDIQCAEMLMEHVNTVKQIHGLSGSNPLGVIGGQPTDIKDCFML